MNESIAMSSERATWNFTYEKGLVDILKELGNIPMFKGQNGWTAEGWRSITNKFNDMFPRANFSKQQVQEKEKELKGNYKVIKEARKSGVGWNDTLGMIIAEPQGWEKMIKDNPKVSKFRKKPFPLYSSLESLYEGSIATGDLNFTSTQPVPPPLVPHPPQRSELQPEPNPRSSISNQPPLVPPPSQSSIGLGGVEGLEVQSDIGTHNLEDLDVTSGKKRKQSQMAAKLEDYLGFRKAQIQKAQEAIEDKKKREEDYSIEKCIDIVDAMEELSDEEKADANEVFENETHRKVLVGTKNPNVRLIWLKKKIARLSTPSSAASSEN